ncbi:MAG: L-threonylcarbamoyladenylate synthase, partial [Rubripirellula sp.]
AKIFAAKGRPRGNPLIVHVASVDQLDRAAALPLEPTIQHQVDALADLWPGPLTIVLPAGKRIPSIVTAGKPTVAVRIPSHPVAQAILARCAFPIAAPSANRSKYVSPTSAAHCQSGLGEHLAMIIDGGECDLGVESTIVSLEETGPRLLRPGNVSAEELAIRLKVSVSDLVLWTSRPPADDQPMLAPGMMREHYSPTTPLYLIDNVASDNDQQFKTGRIAFRRLSVDEANRYVVVETLSHDGNLDEISRGLFAAIRRLDDAGLDRIVIDICEPVGLGRAIMDRIERAAAGHDSEPPKRRDF